MLLSGWWMHAVLLNGTIETRSLGPRQLMTAWQPRAGRTRMNPNAGTVVGRGRGVEGGEQGGGGDRRQTAGGVVCTRGAVRRRQQQQQQRGVPHSKAMDGLGGKRKPQAAAPGDMHGWWRACARRGGASARVGRP